MKISWFLLFFFISSMCYANYIVFPDAKHLGPNSIIIPFQYYQSLILLKSNINDQEGNFILDTGANGLVLNNKYFKSNQSNTAQAYGMAGQLNSIGSSRVDSFFVDQATFLDLSAENIDLTGIENTKKTKILGLIGFDILKDYEIMLNYRERYITISLVDKQGEIIDPLPHTLNKVDSFPFVLGNHIPVIQVTINNIPKWMGIDTGAEYNIIDNKKNRDILDQFKIVNRINITSADGRQKQAIAGELKGVRLSEKYRCATMGTVMSNMQYLDKIYGMNLDGILGHNFLAPWIFSINYKKKMIYLHSLKPQKA